MNYSLTAIHQGIRSLWQYELWKIKRKVTITNFLEWAS